MTDEKAREGSPIEMCHQIRIGQRSALACDLPMGHEGPHIFNREPEIGEYRVGGPLQSAKIDWEERLFRVLAGGPFGQGDG